MDKMVKRGRLSIHLQKASQLSKEWGEGHPPSIRIQGLLGSGLPRAIFLLSILAVLALLIISVVVAWPFTTDDAYIPLRYASNWAHHGQLNWNLDDPERVEGYSSSLYMVLGFFAMKLSISPTLFLKLFSIAALFGSLALVYDLTSRLSNRWFGLLAMAFYAGYYGTIWWGVSGLETPFYVLLALLSFKLYLASLEAPPSIARGLLTGLSTMVFFLGITRPEGPAIGIVLAISLVLRSLINKKRLKAFLIDLTYLAGPFVILYGAFFLARYSYFQEIWPNTYYFKTAFRGDPESLIKMFLAVAAYPLIFGLLGLKNRLKRELLIPAYLYIILLVFLLHGVDPVIAHFNRHASVAVSLTAMVFSLAIHEACRMKPILMVPVATYLFLGQLFLNFGNVGNLQESASLYHERNLARMRLADWLGDQGINSYALGDAGIVPFMTPKSVVYDYYGLNSKAMRSAALADDKKSFFEWLLARRPDAVIVVSSHDRSWRPRNSTQRFLAQEFCREHGYDDEGISFGGTKDKYYYRVLRRRTP